MRGVPLGHSAANARVAAIADAVPSMARCEMRLKDRSLLEGNFLP
jgi:hypothetical protein